MLTALTTRKISDSGSLAWNRLALMAAFSLLLLPIASANAQQSELYENVGLSQDVKDQVKRYREVYTQAVADKRYDEAERASSQALGLLQKVKSSKLYLTLLGEHATLLQKSGKHREAATSAGEALVLYRRALGDRHSFTIRWMMSYAAMLEKLGRLSEAEPLFAEAHASLEATLGTDHPRTLRSLRTHARVTGDLGKLIEAEILYRQALALHRKIRGPKHISTLQVLRDYAVLLGKKNQVADAEPLFAESLALHKEVYGSQHPRTFNALHDLALALVKLERPDEAEPLLAEAFQSSREVLGKKHRRTLYYMDSYAKILFNLNLAQKSSPLYAELMQLRSEVLGPKHPDTMDSIYDYSSSLSKEGRFTEAALPLLKVLELHREVLGESAPETLSSLDSYATLLHKMGRAEEAVPIFAKAMRLRRKTLGFEHPKTLNTMNNLALSLMQLGQHKEAMEMFEHIYESSRNVLGFKDTLTHSSLSNYALMLNRLGKRDKARAIFADAWRGLEESAGPKHPNTISALSNYAVASHISGQTSIAEPLFVRAIGLRQEVLGESHPSTRTAKLALAYFRLRLPERSHLSLQPARSALHDIREARRTIGFLPSEDVQIERSQDKESRYFLNFVDAAWARGPGLSNRAKKAGAEPLANQALAALREESFSALQETMSNSASEAMAQTAARRAAEGVGPELGRLAGKRQSLVGEWVEADKRLTKSIGESGVGMDTKREKLRARRNALENEMKAIDARLRTEAPDYFAFVRPSALSLKQTQAMLAADEAVLMVVPTEFGTHVMAVSDDGIKWARSDWKVGQINAAVKRLLWDVGANVDVSNVENAIWSDEGEGAYPYDRGTAFALYKEIVAPVADALEGKRHLYIATTGSLNSLPLGILVTEKPVGADGNPADLRATRWFADRHALIQIPSLQSLQSLRQAKRITKQQNGRDNFIGFGDPVLSGTAETRGSGGARATRRNQSNNKHSAVISAFRGKRARSGAGIADIQALSEMARLPGTARELEAMRTALKAPQTSIFTAARASESNFRNADLSSADILALATHGLLAGEIRGAAEPGLVFTPPEIATETDDGLLTASEIAGLKLNADWVILSACNTAAGDGSEGAPGLSGLARSFFYAGARNLLASHWPVRDDVAAKITVRTIEIKRDNPAFSRAESFQQAMREIRNDASADSENDTWAHPNAWAPFTLIGDGG